MSEKDFSYPNAIEPVVQFPFDTHIHYSDAINRLNGEFW